MIEEKLFRWTVSKEWSIGKKSVGEKRRSLDVGCLKVKGKG